MQPALERALAPVLRDIAATGAPSPAIEDTEWETSTDTASLLLRSEDGARTGVMIALDETVAEQMVRAADMVQEWVIEERWSSGSNWPPCPDHPVSHPLAAEVIADTATWVCPRGGSAKIAIGSLGSLPRSFLGSPRVGGHR